MAFTHVSEHGYLSLFCSGAWLLPFSLCLHPWAAINWGIDLQCQPGKLIYQLRIGRLLEWLSSLGEGLLISTRYKLPLEGCN